MSDLKNVVAVVTGASSGIGEATARMLAQQGASAVLVARRADRLEAIADEISKAGGVALPLACDITERTAAEGAIKQTIDHFGRLVIPASIA